MLVEICQVFPQPLYHDCTLNQAGFVPGRQVIQAECVTANAVIRQEWCTAGDRNRANSARIRQPRPDCGPDIQARVLQTFQVFLSALGSGAARERERARETARERETRSREKEGAGETSCWRDSCTRSGIRRRRCSRGHTQLSRYQLPPRSAPLLSENLSITWLA